MALRYFKHYYSGGVQVVGPSGRLYYFSPTTVTRVEDEKDADHFLHQGSPETGIYPYRETDVSGNPIGPFPPIDLTLRTSMINPKRFPTDQGVPGYKEWRYSTEVLGDPTLYYHHIRKRIRGPRRKQD